MKFNLLGIYLQESVDGFLPGLWASFSRKFVYYGFSGMQFPALKNSIGVQVDRNCQTLSCVYL
jgi:hypothetical protein